MNVDKYRILVLLSQGDKLSEIARKLGMSQPTVSFHLKSLEEGLGVPLYVMEDHRVVLTDAGLNLASYAGEIVQMEANLQKKAQEYKECREGSIHIGTTLSPGIALLPGILGKYRESCPGIHVQLESGSARTIIRKTQEKELDLAFVSVTGSLPSCFEVRKIREDNLVLIYPMALKSFMEPYGGGEADYRGLGQFPFIHHSPESSTRKMTEAFLERERMVFRNTITADNIFIMKELVRRGAGISMVPASFLEEDEQGIGVLSVPGTELRKEIVLICHKEYYRPPAAERFLESVGNWKHTGKSS